MHQNAHAEIALKKYLLAGAIESVIAVVTLLLLPSDPGSGWLLGYSRSRWMLLAAAFIPAVLFLSLYLSGRKDPFELPFLHFLKIAPSQLLSAAAKLVVLLLVGAIAAANHFLGAALTATPAALLRILPVTALYSLIALQTVTLLCALNRASHGVKWHETLFRFPWASQRLDSLESFLSRQLTWVSAKTPWPVLWALFLAWPLGFNILFSRLFFHTGLKDFIPTTADEVIYWIESTAFMTGGFRGGQISVDHAVAKLDFIHSAAHGPFFPLLQVGIGKLIGWHTYTPVLVNLIILGAALLLFLRILNPDKKALAASWLLLALYLPLYIFIPTNFQQVLHQSFAIIIAALFVRWIRDQEDTTPKYAWWLVLVVFTATLFRYSWMILYLPVLVIAIYRLGKRKTLVLLGAIVVLALVASVSADLLWAPYPADIRFRISAAFKESFQNGLQMALENTINNFAGLVEREGNWIMVFRAQFVFMVLAALAFLIGFANKRDYQNPDRNTLLILVSAINILGIFALNMTLYYVRSWNDYRIWAPHLLLSLLILLFASPRRTFLAVMLIGLVVLVFPGGAFTHLDFAHQQDPAGFSAGVDAFSRAIRETLVFQPEQNRWCNTVEFSRHGGLYDDAPGTFIGLTPGFGFNAILNIADTAPSDLVGKYVLLDPAYVEETAPGLMEQLDIEFLTETPFGNLYLNHDSACPN